MGAESLRRMFSGECLRLFLTLLFRFTTSADITAQREIQLATHVPIEALPESRLGRVDHDWGSRNRFHLFDSGLVVQPKPMQVS